MSGRGLAVLERLDIPRFFNCALKQGKNTFEENIERRKCGADLSRVLSLWKEWQEDGATETSAKLRPLLTAALRLPNNTHPAAWATNEQPVQLALHGQLPSTSSFTEFHKLCEAKHLIRTSNLGNLAGKRSYVLLGPLAELEQGLIRFTLDTLREKDFELLSVPDLLYSEVIEACGMPTTGERNQVYSVEMGNADEKNVCLSGTAEMGIGGLLQDQILDLEEPLRLAAVSRCFRSEISTAEDERGIYRVHAFTKVEMFGVCRNEEESGALHEEFRIIQEEIFSACGLHFRTLEMPVNDLGNAAHRKFDIEAWMPGRDQWGEISSASNCTDYQSRRLNIRFSDKKGIKHFVQTVNGTACAVPRMLIALLETGQTNGSLTIPLPLQNYLLSPWKERVAAHHPINSTFLRKNSQQEKVTELYNAYVW